MWKTITNYPNYKISDCGECINIKTKKTLKPHNIGKRGVKVYIKELNLHFNCVKDCAKYLGIDSSNIFHHLKGKQNTCKGYKIIKEE